jgi:GDPmannose 4,6-dehydratase
MKQKTAFLTGISGRDGYYLSEYLLSLGYKVFGIIRRHSLSHTQDERIANLDVTTFYGDLMDQGSLERIITEVAPDEIYNLGAMSHVRVSFEIPQFTVDVNSVGVLNMLEAYRKCAPKAKFYQASSSEMFGSSVDEDGYQRESTRFSPVSPYGCSKLFAYNLVNVYRESYGLYCCSGILFNHASKLRTEAFVEQKICKAAVRIKLGLQDKLELGNTFSFRDFGHSSDYVRAMHLILQQPVADNYVVATGVTKSINDVVEYVFNKLDLASPFHVVIDPKHTRPNELDYLKGDASRIRALGWEPKFTFETLLDEMIENWMTHYMVDWKLKTIPSVQIKGSDLVVAFNRHNGKK